MADNVNFEELFKQGISSYQAKDFAKAQEYFTNALTQAPKDPTVLTNLGLTEYQLGQKGLAIAYFRKALSIEPDLPTAQAGLKYTISQLEVKELPHKIETYERLRENFLSPFSLVSYLMITAFLFFACGWSLLAYLGRRKRAIQSEQAPPSFPFTMAFLVVGLLFFLFLAGAKLYDQTIPRATIIAAKVSAQAAPGEGQANLFDLYSGLEVIVNQTTDEYAQVTYPGGMTGWIKKNSMMMTSGD